VLDALVISKQVILHFNLDQKPKGVILKRIVSKSSGNEFQADGPA